MEARDIEELRWIVENNLHPLVRVSIQEMLAVASFIASCMFLEEQWVSIAFLSLTIFFVERHIAWCFGPERRRINRINHGR